MQVEQGTDIEKDLGLLAIYNSRHTDYESDADAKEAQLAEIANENFSIIVSELLAIKRGVDDEKQAKKLELQMVDFEKPEFTVTLPEPVTIFPRYRTLPKKKDQTKFEKYMAEKGMQKKKHESKLVFDEMSQDWVYKYGSKGIKKVQQKYDVIREV